MTTTTVDDTNAVFSKLQTVLEGQDIDTAMPALITICANALAIESDGDNGKLALLLLKFFRILETHAIEILGELDNARGGETLQ